MIRGGAPIRDQTELLGGMNQVWVKICGFTKKEEVQSISFEGIDALGLNFYSRSSRYVTEQQACEIASSVEKTVSKVGVFVDSTPEEIRHIFEVVALDYIQLHGDYGVADARSLSDLPLIWVYRMGKSGLEGLQRSLQQLREAKIQPEACLVDARVQGEWGGSGQVVDWDRLASEYNFSDWPRLILAGGLIPENVAQAVQKVHPWGVDVASGVEQNGRKSPELVCAFVEQARS